MRIPQHLHNDPRPLCFGSGTNAETGQRAPLARCRACRHVESCAALRLARTLEQDVQDFGRTYLHARFPFGRPTDRWRPRG